MLLTVANSLHFHSLLCFPFSFTWSIFDLEDYTWDYLEQKYQVKREYQFNSVQFSHSVLSDSLWPRGLQHTRPPCPWTTPGVYSDSCPLNQWCHPTISSSVIPFSSYLQCFPASGSFRMSQFFASGGQSIGVSASASESQSRALYPDSCKGWWLSCHTAHWRKQFQVVLK